MVKEWVPKRPLLFQHKRKGPKGAVVNEKSIINVHHNIVMQFGPL